MAVEAAGAASRLRGRRATTGVLAERVINGWIFLCGMTCIALVAMIFLFIVREALPLFKTYPLPRFLLGREWSPGSGSISGAEFGLVPLLLSSLLVTAGAVALAVPLGVASAVFMAEIAPVRTRVVLKSIVELLAGVPSVVLGFFGATVLAPYLQSRYNLPAGVNMLAGSLTLALMAVPTIATISEDALAAVPRDVREGSLGLGATKWQTVRHVLLPAAFSGIIAAVMLGIGRAIGETMVVLMVTGNGVGSHLTALMNAPGADAAATLKTSPANPIAAGVGAFQHVFGAYTEVCRTMTATIASEMGEVVPGDTHYQALFMLGVVLFLITFAINQVAAGALRRSRTPAERPAPAPVRYAGWGIVGVFGLLFLGGLATTLGVARFLVTAAVVVALVFALRFAAADRRRNQSLMYVLMGLGMAAVLAPTLYVFGALVAGGWRQITWTFLSQAPRSGGTEGGIGPAILGTLGLMIGTVVLALPLGVFAAIYLTEYAKKGPLVRLIRTAIVNLAGVPSIVHGLFGLVVFRIYLGGWLDAFQNSREHVWQNRTLLWGAATLAILVLPIIITATEEALQTVPQSFREGSLGLGATKWQTIRKVVLPAAVPGILTGAILGVGRAAGETAPILFTAAVGFSTVVQVPSPSTPVLALPYHLFYLVTEALNAPDQLKYGVALTLLLLVFAVNLSAIVLRTRLRKARRW